MNNLNEYRAMNSIRSLIWKLFQLIQTWFHSIWTQMISRFQSWAATFDFLALICLPNQHTVKYDSRSLFYINTGWATSKNKCSIVHIHMLRHRVAAHHIDTCPLMHFKSPWNIISGILRDICIFAFRVEYSTCQDKDGVQKVSWQGHDSSG